MIEIYFILRKCWFFILLFIIALIYFKPQSKETPIINAISYDVISLNKIDNTYNITAVCSLETINITKTNIKIFYDSELFNSPVLMVNQHSKYDLFKQYLLVLPTNYKL